MSYDFEFVVDEVTNVNDKGICENEMKYRRPLLFAGLENMGKPQTPREKHSFSLM